MTDERPLTLLCLASELKGVPFLREAKQLGCRVLLLMAEDFAGGDWPWDSIDDHFRMPELSTQPDVTYAVSYLARAEKIDRIVALDDYDVATAASLREHLRLPGMNESTARHFRDKLAMRVRARDAGILAPAFTAVFHDNDVNHFLQQTPPPWVLKPRFEAGAVGIRKLHHGEDVWQALHHLGDQRSFYLLEQFVAGDVFHVDGLSWDGELLFAIASQYGMPPLAVMQGGGIFTTRTLPRESEASQTVRATAMTLLKALGLQQGPSHTEFIRSQADGRFYFLETAARVGGANIERLVEAAAGVVPWQEAARIEAAAGRGETYRLPDVRPHYAGLITCLSRQQHPDLSGYDAPEVVWRLPKAYHAGLLLASPSYERVEQLLTDYTQRFAADFLAVAPPKSDVRTNI